MVHRTGSIEGRRGQISPGNDGTRRHTPHDPLFEKSLRPKPLPVLHFGDKARCGLFVTAIPPVHAIDLEPCSNPWPLKTWPLKTWPPRLGPQDLAPMTY
jgi:hypothetical protein